jgi:sporulation protein YlmC with PRC-barrel domain
MSSSQTKDNSVTLLESAALAAHNLGAADVSPSRQATVHRGMTVYTGEGHTAGRVAAVVLDQEQQEVTHVLLVQERQLLEYRLIPVELIEQVDDEKILLRILQPAVDSFPAWHSA